MTLPAIAPMRAVSGDLPADDDGWAYEVKWDGMPVIVSADKESLTLTSTNGIDATARYPELGPLAAHLQGHQAVPPAAVSRAAHWVAPRLVAEEAFAEWSSEGRLRHPSYLGQRIDKDPSSVVRGPPTMPTP